MLKTDSEVDPSVEEGSDSVVAPSEYSSSSGLGDEDTVNIGPARQEQKSWWRRAGAKVIRWLNPVNAVSFFTVAISNAIQYLSTQSAAEKPEFYGFDPNYIDDIESCWNAHRPADSKYEGMVAAFQNDWIQWPVVFCIVLSASDLVYDAKRRDRNARSALRHREQLLVQNVTDFAIQEAYRAADEGYTRTDAKDYKSLVHREARQIYMKSRAEPKQNDPEVSEPVAIRRFSRDYWYGFFRDSHGKFSFPYKWIVHPTFCTALLYYIFGGRHAANQFEQDIPVEYNRLIHQHPFEDIRCLNLTVIHYAGDGNLNSAVICGLLIPALAMGGVVTAMGIRKAYRALTAHRTTGERVMLHDEHSLEDYGAVERTPIPLIEPV